ncbi:hypothetical protein ACIBU0_39160 [Streptomyces sp. NPDC049627]|uniref:hypothetical protein n=1 Tax=Streptomyces sp. NPDC049627 TaxID=3365595 RepID=UPI0037A9F7FE
MCVHVKNWREDAQPEWPEAASRSGGGASAGGARGDTQAFPATGETEVPGQGHRSRSEARETEIPHGGGRASAGADETAILRIRPRAAASDADETAVLPAVGEAADGRRAGGTRDAWSAFDRPSTPRNGTVPASGTDGFRPSGAGTFPSPGAGPYESSPGAGTVPSPETSAFRSPETRAFPSPETRAFPSPETRAFPSPETRGFPSPETDAFPAPAETRASAVRDPWSEPEESAQPAASGATHDPHEVTVQLDGVGLHLDNMLRAAKSAPGGGADASDGPVFVDESGRRSRLYRRIGMAVGLACAVYAVVILATLLSGTSDAPWLPVEGPKDEQPAGQVDTPPLPAESAPQPSGTGSVSPGASPTAGSGTSLSPGADATAPGASAGAQDPAASADPRPSTTRNAPDPGTDPAPDPDPTTEPTAGDPDPTPTDGGATQVPTDPPTTVDPGTGTVADGRSDPTPIAQERDDTASSSAALSPEHTL